MYRFTVEQFKTGNLAKHFKLSEFACKGKNCCGGSVAMDYRLISLLESLRSAIDQPLIISSAFRCKKHNKSVGGASSSLHLFGYAADIIAPPGYPVDSFAELAQSFPFGCVIRYPNRGFIHVDVRETIEQVRLVM